MRKNLLMDTTEIKVAKNTKHVLAVPGDYSTSGGTHTTFLSKNYITSPNNGGLDPMKSNCINHVVDEESDSGSPTASVDKSPSAVAS